MNQLLAHFLLDGQEPHDDDLRKLRELAEYGQACCRVVEQVLYDRLGQADDVTCQILVLDERRLGHFETIWREREADVEQALLGNELRQTTSSRLKVKK